MIKGLHDSAYRCRDSEETRKFDEEFLGLKLIGTLDIKETKSARKRSVLHTFYQMDDGSCLAFFEAPEMRRLLSSHKPQQKTSRSPHEPLQADI